jgi:hypothetical protein
MDLAVCPIISMDYLRVFRGLFAEKKRSNKLQLEAEVGIIEKFLLSIWTPLVVNVSTLVPNRLFAPSLCPPL